MYFCYLYTHLVVAMPMSVLNNCLNLFIPKPFGVLLNLHSWSRGCYGHQRL